MLRCKLRSLNAEDWGGLLQWGGGGDTHMTLLQAIVNDAWGTLHCSNALQLLNPLTSDQVEFLCNRQ